MACQVGGVHADPMANQMSVRGIEVDKAKIEVIEQLPPPVNIKGICSFLGHVGFTDDLLRTSHKSLGY